MNCNKCFIGINHRTNGLFVGVGDLRKNGTIKYKQKSDDKTVEIVNAVANMMRIKLNKQDKKPYFGYEIPRCGKLVLIKPGYDFEVRRKRKDDIERPVSIY